MEYRQFSDTGIQTSLLGMGCMRLPRTGNGDEIDYSKAEEIIDYAYNHGVNYYDSAYVYNRGESERVMGKALSKYPRSSYMLATKMPNMKCRSRKMMLDTFNEQLERLGVDYIDFYLCHNVSEGSIDIFLQDFVFETLEDLRTQGKIRYLGFSSHGKPETLERFVKSRKWDFAQIQFNYLDWSYQDAKRQYEILEENGVPVVVMEPVRGGRLASVTPDADKLFKDYAPNNSVASWALRFAAGFPNMQVVLSGMSTMEQVQDNVATIEGFKALNAEEREIIDKAVELLLSQSQLPCTECRYCVDDCPAELNIPELLKIYNEYNLSKNPMTLSRLQGMPEDKRPGSCQACRECVSHCPQNIEIPDALEALDKASKVPFRR